MSFCTIQNLCLFLAVTLLSMVDAQVPIFSSQQAQRAALNNSLMFDPFALPPINLDGGVVATAGDVDNLPSLALPDVSMAFAQATIPSGQMFPNHVHPLATEMLLNLAGQQRVTITQELTLSPLVFTTKPGQIVTVPQGLPHETKCLSEKPCRFFASFNSPSPGTVFVASPPTS